MNASSPWVIAHRGASKDRPENTIAAFDEALRQGADGIELDVQLTRDGVPVVYHDRTLWKAGGGRRRVAGCDLVELRSLVPGRRLDIRDRGQHIPTLDEVLSRYGRRTRLLVEIKTREGAAGRARHLQLARTVATMIRRNKLQRRTWVLSFDAEVLDACAGAARGVRRVLNLKPPRTLREALRLRLASLDALSVDVRTLTPAFGAAVARAGRPLFVYTCNTPQAVRRARTCGATAVMADRPAWLTQQLRHP